MLKALQDIQHQLNPLHVFCRLIEKGFKKGEALAFASLYEELIYPSISESLIDLQDRAQKQIVKEGKKHNV